MTDATARNGGHDCALVVEGGAMRGIFAAGVLDQFLAERFAPFDLHIGVSAGACNLASHLAGQAGRNHRIYTDYSCRPEFISMRSFLRGGHLIDLDWLWEITIREIRLDLDAIARRRDQFLITLTTVAHGRALYLRPTADDLEDMLKASSAVPHLYRDFPTIRGQLVTDGGVADSIPVREAHRRGARRIMVIRSRPADFVKKPGLGARLSALSLRKHPALAATIRGRAASYNDALHFIDHPPPGVRVLQLTPPPAPAVRRLTRDRDLLEASYRIGRARGQQAIQSWNGTG